MNVIEYILKIQDQASSQLNTFKNAIVDSSDQIDGKLKKALNETGQSMVTVGGIMAAAGGGLLTLGKSAVEMAGRFEQAEKSFQVLTGSVEKGTELFNKLKDFAKQTPFELVDLQQYTTRLLAMGAAQNEVIDELSMLGDIASAVGMEKMPQLVLAFGQIRAKTKLTGEELRQLNETGVPIVEALVNELNKNAGAWVNVSEGAKKTNIDVDATNKQLAIAKQRLKEATDAGNKKESTMMSLRNSVEKYEQKLAQANGTASNTTKVWRENKVTAEDIVSNTKEMGIKFETVEKALKSMTAEGGIYYGMMIEQSKTALGKVSNLQDAYGIFSAELGRALLPTVKKILDYLIDVLGKFGQWANEHQKLIQLVAVLAIGITSLGVVISGLGATILALNVIFQSTIGTAVLGISGLLVVVIGAIAAFTLWKDQIIGFWNSLPPLVQILVGFAAAVTAGSLAWIAVKAALIALIPVLSTVMTGLVSIGATVVGFVSAFALPIVIVGALAAAFALCYTSSDSFKNAVNNVMTSLNNSIGTYMNVQIQAYQLKQATDDLEASTQKLISVQDKLQGAHLNVEQAELTLERTTKLAKDAVAKYGATSLEARQAELDRKRSVEDLDQAKKNLSAAETENTKVTKENHELYDKVDSRTKALNQTIEDSKNKWNSLSDAIKGAIDGFLRWIGIKEKNGGSGGGMAFADGGYVPYTGNALVHAGEFVLSRDMLNGRQSIPQSIQKSINNNVSVNANVSSEVDAMTLGNILGSQLAFNNGF